MENSACGSDAVDPARVDSFLQNNGNDCCRKLAQNYLKIGLAVLSIFPACMVLAILAIIGAFLGVFSGSIGMDDKNPSDGGLAWLCTLYILFVVLPFASSLVVVSLRCRANVLPDHRLCNGQKLNDGPVRRFLLTSFCCFAGDRLVTYSQASRIFFSEIGELVGVGTAFVGAIFGAAILVVPDDESQGPFFMVFCILALFLLVAVFWYFIIKKALWQNPSEAGYGKANSNVPSTELV